ncbi:MAG: 3-keto-disaccharide hydrolase [Limisphaerales bacterium]
MNSLPSSLPYRTPRFPQPASELTPSTARRHGIPGVIFACALSAAQLLAAADQFMGEYRGSFSPDTAVKLEATAKVVAEGDGYYRVVMTSPGRDGREGAVIEIYGREFGPEVGLFGRAGGYDWSGSIKHGQLFATSGYEQSFQLTRIESQSPKAALPPPAGAVVLLPFEPERTAELSQWTNREWKALDHGVMEAAPGKGANRTRREFGRIQQLHLEFWLPREPRNRGQGRANSGVYLADHYEVQILDSFGLTHTSGDCGGLYGIARARVNASLPPETWQTYDITFEPAELDARGQTAQPPRITVWHNGVLIHDRQEIPMKKHRLQGPLQLQDHGHPIRFRNIWLIEAP